MTPIATRILESTSEETEGFVFSAKEYLHLGTRAAVDQALSRLSREGKLIRVSRGRYTLPVVTRFGTRPPAAERVVEQLAKSTGEVIVSSGAAAANKLGLTTQVPVRRVYLTSGKSRRVKFGNETIELQHASHRILQEPASTTGSTIRALEWLGQTHAKQAIEQLRTTLVPGEQEELLKARARMTTWMAELVSQLVPVSAVA